MHAKINLTKIIHTHSSAFVHRRCLSHESVEFYLARDLWSCVLMMDWFVDAPSVLNSQTSGLLLVEAIEVAL